MYYRAIDLIRLANLVCLVDKRVGHGNTFGCSYDAVVDLYFSVSHFIVLKLYLLGHMWDW